MNLALNSRHTYLNIGLSVSEEDEIQSLNTELIDKKISAVLHDLRSPLQPICSLSETLESDYEKLSRSEVNDIIHSLHSGIKTFSNMMDELLKWMNHEQKEITFNPASVNLSDAVDAAIVSQKLYLSQKHINIINNIDASIQIYADNQMLNSIMNNLISNAVKFSFREGTVEVNALAGDSYVEVSVTDSGLGIPDAIRKKLFESNGHITGQGTVKEKKYSTGLKLCRDYVERHTGEIKVESKLDEGSRFSFTMPNFSSDDIVFM